MAGNQVPYRKAQRTRLLASDIEPVSFGWPTTENAVALSGVGIGYPNRTGNAKSSCWSMDSRVMSTDDPLHQLLLR